MRRVRVRARPRARVQVSRSYTFGSKGTSVGLFYKKYLQTIKLNEQAVAWGQLDLSYLLRDEYERRFSHWLTEAKAVGSIAAAKQEAVGGGGDIKVMYRTKAELVAFCKARAIMPRALRAHILC